jgi:hypothetical protein
MLQSLIVYYNRQSPQLLVALISMGVENVALEDESKVKARKGVNKGKARLLVN